jgi:hypothetical protein
MPVIFHFYFYFNAQFPFLGRRGGRGGGVNISHNPIQCIGKVWKTKLGYWNNKTYFKRPIAFTFQN